MSDPSDNQPSDEESDDGLSVLDLANLPPAQVKVMRVMLREVEVHYAALCAHFESLAADERLSRSELDEILQTLVGQQWLMQIGDLYKANLRRKSSRTLSEFQPPRRKSMTLRGIWDSLEQPDKPDESES